MEGLNKVFEDLYDMDHIPAIGFSYETENGGIVSGVYGAGSSQKFHLGSCAKSVTAALVAQLHDEGLLSFDAKLQELLPEFVGTALENVTIFQLLTHTGGLLNEFPEEEACVLRNELKIKTPRESRATFVEKLKNKPLRGIPGDCYGYSNAGYSLLGYIAENATGKDFESLLLERLAEPLEMMSLGFGVPTDGVCGHTEEGEKSDIQDSGFDHPSLGLHCKMEHWAIFGRLFRRLLQGEQDALKPLRICDETAKKLIDPVWTPKVSICVGFRKVLLSLKKGKISGDALWSTYWICLRLENPMDG